MAYRIDEAERLELGAVCGLAQPLLERSRRFGERVLRTGRWKSCCIAMSAWISLFARTCRSWRIAATAVVANTSSEQNVQRALQNSTDTLGNFAPFVASRRA